MPPRTWSRVLAHLSPGLGGMIVLVLVAIFADIARLDNVIHTTIKRVPYPVGEILILSFWAAVILPLALMYAWHRRTMRLRRLEHELRIRVKHEVRESKEWQARVQRIQRILETPQDLRILYQPIVALGSRRICGYEALSRFPGGASPDKWFSEASEVGMLGALEELAIIRALEGLSGVPEETYVSLNVSPSTLLDRHFFTMFRDVPADRLIIELTEHLRIDEYDEYGEVLAKLRRLGLRLAVDDAGAGWSSLRHILQLRPDMVKTDRSLLDGVPGDPVPTILLKALAEFVQEIPGAILIAEGVETQAQVTLLRDININYAQGFLFGRPQSLKVLTSANGQTHRLVMRALTPAPDRSTRSL